MQGRLWEWMPPLVALRLLGEIQTVQGWGVTVQEGGTVQAGMGTCKLGVSNLGEWSTETGATVQGEAGGGENGVSIQLLPDD